MNPIERPLMLEDARERALRELDRYPNAARVRVTVDGVAYTFARSGGDIELLEAKETPK